MKNWKKLLSLLLVFAMVFALTACGSSGNQAAAPAADASAASAAAPAADDAVYTIKLATNEADVEDLNFDGDIAERLKEASNGKINLEIVYIESIGSPVDALNMVRDGMVDLYFNAAGLLATEFPVMGSVGDIPMLCENPVEITDLAYALYYKGWFDKELEGFVPLLFGTGGMQMIFTQDKIETYEGMKNVKIRVANGLCATFAENMGAVPVTIGRADTYMSLQTGVVSAMLNTPWSTRANSQYEVTDYIINTGLFGGIKFVLMNEEMYNSYPADVQLALTKVFADLADSYKWHQVEGQQNDMRMLTEDYGMEIVEWSDEDVEKLREAAAPIKQAAIDTINEQGIDGKALMDYADAIISYYNEGK